MRDNKFDIVKGVGIILDVIGHVTNDIQLFKFIYSFHMPLFFFVSGHFSTVKNEEKTISFFNKKVRTILWPYLVFYLLTYVYWLILERNMRSEVSGIVVDWWYPLFGLVYGTNIYNSMINNTVLWFLPCLFSVTLIYYLLKKTAKSNTILFISLILLALIGFIFTKTLFYANFRLPFGLDIAFIGLLFYGFGNILYKPIKKVMDLPMNWIFIVLFIFSFGIHLVIFQKNIVVNMMSGTYGNVFLFVLVAALGIIMTYLLAKVINESRILQYIGKNSLLILVLHGPLLRVFIYLASKILNISISDIKSNYFYSISMSILAIGILVPAIVLVNRKFSFLIGKFSSKNS